MIWLWLSIASGQPPWCATPLPVHEWGVRTAAMATKDLPGASPHATKPPLDRPPEHPVLQVHPSWTKGESVPFALEVGLKRRQPSEWHPRPRPRTISTRPPPQADPPLHPTLVTPREELIGSEGQHLGPPPVLRWRRLTLHKETPAPLPSSPLPWINTLRDLESAAWIQADTEVERLLFYDAHTQDGSDLTLIRGASYAPGHTHLLLHNRGRYPVHDVVLTTPSHQVTVPQIPAGASAGFLLEEHPRRDPQVRAWLQSRWTTESPSSSDCVTNRDPSIPTKSAQGHRLLPREVDTLLSTWEAALFPTTGWAISYREDTAHLDNAIPLAVYTDPHHDIQLRRLSLVVVRPWAPQR